MGDGAGQGPSLAPELTVAVWQRVERWSRYEYQGERGAEGGRERDSLE